ncbi:MlaD family protein [Sphingobium aquiterrae]|uniref:MlaD family protein n=1 Tax=Sphingobium aquiterrae TaxID=2038656 RepID=UPI003019D7F6|tara:strand:- start:698 stop:1633 length:936 start_codon:yes stop_codon:yes gene_type:complete
MERHASYALVGIISTALLIAAIVFVVWLGGSRFGTSDDPYRIIFHGPVRGLSVGAEVQFNGIKVGQIERIRLDERDPNRVVTDVILSRGTPVRVDSLASTELQGISGVSIVQISAGTPGKPLLRKTSRARRPVIQSKPNALSSLLQGGGQVVQNAGEALQRVNRLLSDRNIDAVGAMVQDLRLTTGELAANRAMFANAASTLVKLDRAADDIQGAAASVRTIAEGDGRNTIAEISATARELKAAVAEARITIANINRQSGTIGSTTLPAVNATMQSLQETVESLDGLIREIRQNPRRALGKDSGRELELSQ